MRRLSPSGGRPRAPSQSLHTRSRYPRKLPRAGVPDSFLDVMFPTLYGIVRMGSDDNTRRPGSFSVRSPKFSEEWVGEADGCKSVRRWTKRKTQTGWPTGASVPERIRFSSPHGKQSRSPDRARVTLLRDSQFAPISPAQEKAATAGRAGPADDVGRPRDILGSTLADFRIAGQSKIRTIDGLARAASLHPVQQAFCDHDALMCGFCTRASSGVGGLA